MVDTHQQTIADEAKYVILVGWKSIRITQTSIPRERIKQASVMRRMANSEQRVFFRFSVSQSNKADRSAPKSTGDNGGPATFFFFSYWVPRKTIVKANKFPGIGQPTALPRTLSLSCLDPLLYPHNGAYVHFTVRGYCPSPRRRFYFYHTEGRGEAPGARRICRIRYA